MLLTIAGRELRGGLVTPLPWILLGGGQVVLAWIFLQTIETLASLEAQQRVVNLTLELCMNLFGFAAAIALLTAPLLAMRMLSGEFRDGSFILLETASVRLWRVVAGKFLGLALLMTPLCLLPAANLALLALTGAALPDPGHLAAATLGLWLAALMFGAVGLHAASLSAQPGAGVLVAFAVLLLFSIVGRAETLAAPLLPESLSLLGWLSWNEHLFRFLLGVVRLSDIAYFLLFTLVFLALTHRRLANRRFA